MSVAALLAAPLASSPLQPLLTNDTCPDGVRFFYSVLGVCVLDTRQWAAVICGLVSIVAWIIYSLPQIRENYRSGMADQAISPWFLVFWAGGDTCNFVGAFLTHQLLLQTVQACYQMLVDGVLIAQFVLARVRRIRRRKRGLEGGEGGGGAGAAGVGVGVGGGGGERGDAPDSALLDGGAGGAAAARKKWRQQQQHPSEQAASINDPPGGRIRHTTHNGDDTEYDDDDEDILDFQHYTRDDDRRRLLNSSTKTERSSQIIICCMALGVCSALYLVAAANAHANAKVNVNAIGQSEPRQSAAGSRRLLWMPVQPVEWSRPLSDWRAAEVAANRTHPIGHGNSIFPFRHLLLNNVQRMIGYVIGWLSTMAYLFARLPQIYLSFKRKTTEGLHFSLFLCSFIGNFTYGMQILLTSLDPVYVLMSLPWILGSWGVIALDMTILIQIFIYRKSRVIQIMPNDYPEISA